MEYEPRFSVRLIVNNYPYRGGFWDNVTMTVYNPDGVKQYLDSVPPPHDDHCYSTAAYMAEHFTEEQAEQVKAWIVERHGPNVVSATVEPVDMDWVKENDDHIMPTSGIPLGGGDEMYVFSDTDGYDLDVNAAGHCYLHDGVAVYQGETEPSRYLELGFSEDRSWLSGFYAELEVVVRSDG